MPISTRHALITWIPGSEDGRREAKNLNKKFNLHSAIKAPERLEAGEAENYMVLIVVGHREEFTKYLFDSLVTYLSLSRASWVVLAMCNSARKKYFGTLCDGNEQHSPAQLLANRLNIKVTGTNRDLLFHEVGQGHAFTLALGEVLIPTNTLIEDKLWHVCTKQDEIEELTDAFASL